MYAETDTRPRKLPALNLAHPRRFQLTSNNGCKHASRGVAQASAKRQTFQQEPLVLNLYRRYEIA
jgi:hypothetical protein